GVVGPEILVRSSNQLSYTSDRDPLFRWITDWILLLRWYGYFIYKTSVQSINMAQSYPIFKFIAIATCLWRRILFSLYLTMLNTQSTYLYILELIYVTKCITVK